MKKKVISFLRCYFICIMLVLNYQSGKSQVPDPSLWSTFVQGEENTLLLDTFRLQTFSEAAIDNWNYTLTGNAELFDPSTVPTLSDASDGLAVRLYPGGQIAFDIYPLLIYTNIKVFAPYAMKDVKKGVRLHLYCAKDIKSIDMDYLTPQETTNKSFTEPHGFYNSSEVRISGSLTTGDPRSLVLSVPDTTLSNPGYYAIDKAYAYGDIPRYSLFSGNGLWDESECWSHLPPERNREALVNGDLTIDSDVHCRSIYVYDSNIRFSASGSLALDDAFVVYHTLPEKGKWYFISFPFDVYPEDIDPDIELKDDTPNAGGNFFYLCNYDGWRRAEQQDASGNWTVISPSSLVSGEPLFKKNKGYLIALDEKANKQTLCFTGRNLSPDFGRNGSIPITTAPNVSGSSKEHYGWQLCGNPFPSELRLSDIESNPDLDGFIYVLEESEFKAYAIGSQYAIPPYSAFFVKADRDTELQMSVGETAEMYSTVALSALSKGNWVEPRAEEVSLTSASISKSGIPRCWLQDSFLYVENMPAPGNVYVYDLFGRICTTLHVPAGDSHHLFSLSPGIYSITLGVGKERWRSAGLYAK